MVAENRCLRSPQEFRHRHRQPQLLPHLRHLLHHVAQIPEGLPTDVFRRIAAADFASLRSLRLLLLLLLFLRVLFALFGGNKSRIGHSYRRFLTAFYRENQKGARAPLALPPHYVSQQCSLFVIYPLIHQCINYHSIIHCLISPFRNRVHYS